MMDLVAGVMIFMAAGVLVWMWVASRKASGKDDAQKTQQKDQKEE